MSLFPGGVSGKVIAVWGLAFKPETDDVRESPAGRLVKRLIELGATIRAHDPEAAANFAQAYAPQASYFDNEYDTVDGADLNDDAVGGSIQNVSQEAVQEFQIATQRYSAELGRSAGSVGNVITRRGKSTNAVNSGRNVGAGVAGAMMVGGYGSSGIPL